MPTANGAGFWFLSGTGDLTYNIASRCAAPVPLPAAIWLLGSGLLGMAGIARRRSQLPPESIVTQRYSIKQEKHHVNSQAIHPIGAGAVGRGRRRAIRVGPGHQLYNASTVNVYLSGSTAVDSTLVNAAIATVAPGGLCQAGTVDVYYIGTASSYSNRMIFCSPRAPYLEHWHARGGPSSRSSRNRTSAPRTA